MKLSSRRVVSFVFILFAASLALASPAKAAQYSYLDPAYTQDIYTGPIPAAWGPGFGWSSGGNLLLHGDGTIHEYSLTDNTMYNGTAVHGVIGTHTYGAGVWGYGMTNGTDGYLYTNTSSGIYQIDPATWTGSLFPGSAGGNYGIGTLPDGKIVHATGWSHIYVLDPVTGTDTFIYDPGSFIDDLAVAPTGEIFLADLGSWKIHVIDSTGAVINVVSVTHGPDGMAFGAGAAFANNTDGTITKLNFSGPGYTGSVTETIFASGGSYGDLASVGPDGAFYVSQWGWGGINWDNGNSSVWDSAVVRISLTGGGGFDPGPGTGTVPEPGALALLGIGLTGMAIFRRVTA